MMYKSRKVLLYKTFAHNLTDEKENMVRWVLKKIDCEITVNDA